MILAPMLLFFVFFGSVFVICGRASRVYEKAQRVAADVFARIARRGKARGNSRHSRFAVDLALHKIDRITGVLTTQIRPIPSPIVNREIHIPENVSQADFTVDGQLHFQTYAVIRDVQKLALVSVRRDLVLHRVILQQRQQHRYDGVHAVGSFHADDRLIPVKHISSGVAVRNNVVRFVVRACVAVHKF